MKIAESLSEYAQKNLAPMVKRVYTYQSFMSNSYHMVDGDRDLQICLIDTNKLMNPYALIKPLNTYKQQLEIFEGEHGVVWC